MPIGHGRLRLLDLRSAKECYALEETIDRPFFDVGGDLIPM